MMVVEKTTVATAPRAGSFPLSELDIVVGASAGIGAEQVVRQLQRERAKVRHLWPLPEKMPSDVDVVMIEYGENLLDRLPWMPGEPNCALIVLVSAEHAFEYARIADCTPEAVLFLPAQGMAITATISLALAQFNYTKRLRDRIERLDQNLRTIRNVERAKTILVTTKGLSEDAAYKFLRKQAMEHRTTVNAVASAVIDSYELLR